MAVNKVVKSDGTTLIDISGTTATASDVASGKVFFGADGTQKTGTASGGASNIVTGTFTGSTEGEAMTISLPYTGSGYPVAAMIYPSAGPYNTDSTIYSTLQRYAVIMWHMVKTYPSATPAYTASGTADYGTVLAMYKSSASDATSTTSNRTNENPRTYSENEAANSWSNAVRFNSATTMSVYIAGTSYGFKAGVEYTYQIVYSS